MYTGPLSDTQNDERREFLERRASEGASTGDVSRELNVSVAGISQWLVRHGYYDIKDKLRANSNRGRVAGGEERAQQIAAWLKEGKTRKDMAAELGISPPAVTQWIRFNAHYFDCLKDIAATGFRIRAKPKKPALDRERTRLARLLRVKQCMQSGYTMQDASRRIGQGESYAWVCLKRHMGSADYYMLIAHIGELWEMLHPDKDDPIEYARMPRLAQDLYGSPTATKRLRFHHERWRRQEGLTTPK